jgi:hypothetical protein
MAIAECIACYLSSSQAPQSYKHGGIELKRGFDVEPPVARGKSELDFRRCAHYQFDFLPMPPLKKLPLSNY